MNISNILLLCNSTCNNDQSLTLDDIKNGKCDDMCLHCNYFSEWGSQISLTHKYELYCQSNPCLDIDIILSTDTILIIDCISTDSCNQLSTHGNNALLIYIETNKINALTDSEIYCRSII
eukprot:540317_1